jgi:hypothetical protein
MVRRAHCGPAKASVASHASHGRAHRPASARPAPRSGSTSPANSAREASSKPGQVAGHRLHEAVRRPPARRGGGRRRPDTLRASSTSLRNATEAPPGCAASQSQCRGSRVISRATTPSFGPAGFAWGRRRPRCRPRAAVAPAGAAGRRRAAPAALRWCGRRHRRTPAPAGPDAGRRPAWPSSRHGAARRWRSVAGRKRRCNAGMDWTWGLQN